MRLLQPYRKMKAIVCLRMIGVRKHLLLKISSKGQDVIHIAELSRKTRDKSIAFVEESEPEAMHQLMTAIRDRIVAEIKGE